MFLKKSHLFHQTWVLAKEIQQGHCDTSSNTWAGSLAPIFVVFSHSVKNCFPRLAFPKHTFQPCCFQVSSRFPKEVFAYPADPHIFSIPTLCLLASCKTGWSGASATASVSNRICKVGLAPALNPAEGSSANSNYRHSLLHHLDVASFQFFCILACLHRCRASQQRLLRGHI